MGKSVRRRSVVRMVSLVALVLASVSVQADHSWNGYHWARTSNPFMLKAGDNVSAEWDAYLDEAIADWNNSRVLILEKVPGTTTPSSCRPTLGQIELCSAWSGNNNWLGLATIWITSGKHIVQATARVNDYYFAQPRYDTPAWRRLVMCQEVGHDFGLDHQDEVFDNANLGTCMDYTNDPDGGAGGAVKNDKSNEHPNRHDYEELEIIYEHLDSTTTAGQTTTSLPPAMTDIDWSSPRNWGRLMRSTNGGRTEVYEQDFGRGNRVVTFVIWADPRARGNQAQ